MKRLFLCVALFALATATAHAHESRPAYLELQQKSKDTYDLLWKIPARGPEKRLGLYVRLPDDSTIVAQTTSSFLGGAFIERSTISRSGGLAGAEIYIEGLSTTLTDVLVRIGRLDGSTQVVRLTPSVPSFVVDAAPTVMGVAKTYLVLGMQHIWKGVDHLLFVACLIMIAGTWRRILITITGFTVAHSITLALAALELVRLPEMIYRVKFRVKVPSDRAATDKRRETVAKLIGKHGGKNETPNPRQHVVGIFTDKAAMKAFRTEARTALSA